MNEVVGIALDLGSVHTGAFAFTGDTPRRPTRLDCPAQPSALDAWRRMALEVVRLLELHRPDWVALEDTYHGPNPHTTAVLNKLQGAVVAWCDLADVPVFVGSTAEIDAACGLPGRLSRPARKAATAAFARLLGYVCPQDCADALAVGWWAKGVYYRERVVEEATDG